MRPIDQIYFIKLLIWVLLRPLLLVCLWKFYFHLKSNATYFDHHRKHDTKIVTQRGTFLHYRNSFLIYGFPQWDDIHAPFQNIEFQYPCALTFGLLPIVPFIVTKITSSYIKPQLQRRLNAPAGYQQSATCHYLGRSKNAHIIFHVTIKCRRAGRMVLNEALTVWVIQDRLVLFGVYSSHIWSMMSSVWGLSYAVVVGCVDLSFRCH